MTQESEESFLFNYYRFFCIFLLGDEADSASTRQRKKKSRWGGSESDKTFIPGMPTVLPPSLDSHQQEAYLGKDNTHFIRFLVDFIEFSDINFYHFQMKFY